MRRAVLLGLVGVILLLSTHLSAQGSARPPFRVGRGGNQPPVAQESIAISDPSGASVTTAASSIVVAGPLSNGLVTQTVTWGNALTGGSGTATVNTSTKTYSTAVAASALRFQDDVIRTVSAQTSTTTPTAGSWSDLITDGSDFCRSMSSDYIQPNVALAAGNIVACELVPSSTISGGNYDVWMNLSSAWSPGSSGNSALMFDIVDVTAGTRDFCALEFLVSTANPDVRLVKTLNNASTTIASANMGPLPGQTHHLKVRGDVIDVWLVDAGGQDSVRWLTATDADCHRAATGRAALAYGDVFVGGGKTVSTGGRVNFLRMEDASAGSGGIPLNVGDNLITITGTAVDGTTYTAKVHVIRQGSDTTPPTISTTSPSANTDYATAATMIDFAGLADDPGGAVASVVVSCPAGSPTTPTVSLVNGVWSAATVTFVAGGTRTCTITATDTASLTTVLTRNIIIAAAGDSVDPTITISTPNGAGSSSTSSSTVSFAGTAADNIALQTLNPVIYSSDFCGSGVAGAAGGGTSLNWTATAIPISRTCVFTFTAIDASGRTASATHTVTYNAPLSIVTPPSVSTVEGATFSFCFQITGGTAPYTLTKLTGTFPTGIAISGTCIADTSVNVGTAGTYAGHSYRVTDNVGAMADTSTFTLTVGTAGTLGGQDQSYYDALFGRSDKYQAYNMRDNQMLATASSQTLTALSNQHCGITNNRMWWYDPVNDTNPERQDAAKMVLCTWIGPSAGFKLSEAMGLPDANGYSLITVPGAGSAVKGRLYRYDDEFVVCAHPTSPDAQCDIDATHMWVIRGTYGTTATTHVAGTISYILGTKLLEQLFFPINNDPTANERYLITWDFFPSARGFQGLGAAGDCSGIPVPVSPTSQACSVNSNGFKAFQIRCPSICLETKFFSGYVGTGFPPGQNRATDVGWMGLRAYLPIGPPAYINDPVRPRTNEFVVKPSEWVRYWIYIEHNAETNTSAFVPLAPLNSGISDVDTTISIDMQGIPQSFDNVARNNVVTNGSGSDLTKTSTKMRRARLGSEIIALDTCGAAVAVINTDITCTIIRGVDGTTPASHAAGAMVELIWSYYSLYMASGTQGPVLVYDRVPFVQLRNSKDGAPATPQALSDFNIEFDDSASRVLQNRVINGFDKDMEAYMKNLVMLRLSGSNSNSSGGSTLPATWTPLITAPSVTGN